MSQNRPLCTLNHIGHDPTGSVGQAMYLGDDGYYYRCTSLFQENGPRWEAWYRVPGSLGEEYLKQLSRASLTDFGKHLVRRLGITLSRQ